MHGVVSIRGLKTLYYLPELPDDRSELDLVVEGATLDIDPGLETYPDMVPRRCDPELGRSRTDPKRFRLFGDPNEVEPAGFQIMDHTYGGVRTPEQWRQKVKRIPEDRAYAAIPPDPPEAVELFWKYLREG